MKNLYVVEGLTDYKKLTNLGFHYVYPINGHKISERMLEFFKLVQKERKVVLLFDPDLGGDILRNLLKKELYNFQIPHLLRSECKKGRKIGVAEASDEYLLSALKGLLNFDNKQEELPSISEEEVNSLNIDLDMLVDLLHVRKDNVVTDLCILNINLDKLKEIINENLR